MKRSCSGIANNLAIAMSCAAAASTANPRTAAGAGMSSMDADDSAAGAIKADVG